MTLQEWKDKPLVFGKTDCAQMAARYVEHLTGENLAEKFFDYGNHHAANDLIDSNNGLVGVVTKCLGMPSDGEVQPGDVCVLDAEGNETVAIYNGHYFFTVAVVQEEVLRVLVDKSNVLARWSV